MKKKVVIIGAGLGGLSCGLILQREGFEVTILEQNAQIGGCLQCFTRNGVKFETGMHFIGSAAPGENMYSMFEYLELTESLQLSPLDTSCYNIINLDGQRFCFPNGREPFFEQMCSYFPNQKNALRKYIKIIDEVSAESALNFLRSKQRDGVLSTRYHTTSINAILNEIFTDEMIKNVLVGDLPLYAAERDKTPFSQHAFILDFYNKSAFRVVGGSDVIAHELKKRICHYGGQVFSKKKVVRIACNDALVTGIETADESFYPADYIISAIHPNRMLELVDSKLLRPAFRTRIKSISQTTGGFMVYLKFKDNAIPYMRSNYFGYRNSSPWGCEQYTDDEWPKGFLYMHHCHKPNPVFAESGVIISYMNYLDVAQWQHLPMGHRGKKYEDFKREHAERLLASLEKHFPGVQNAIECFYTSTPLTFKDYTGTECGSMYGVAKDIALGVAGRVPYRTKIPNLYLAGQNVNSHGIMGVMVGSIVTCNEIKKKKNE